MDDQAPVEIRVRFVRIPSGITDDSGPADSVIPASVDMPVNPEVNGRTPYEVLQIRSIGSISWVFIGLR
jgi:hypothetical protein